MIKIYFTIFILLAAFTTQAQTVRYAVKLKYKKSTAFTLSQPSSFLSQKAIQRRSRQRIAIDSTDLPVNPVYLDSIKNISGVVIVNISKWLNQVMIETTDPASIDKINAFPFVLVSDNIALHHHEQNDLLAQHVAPAETNTPATSGILSVDAPAYTEGINEDTINYGNNYPQVHIHEGEYLHKLGFRGQGMTIAVLDGGFLNYKINRAFDSLRFNNQILSEYDFVMKDTSVNEDNTHGANCLSILAANMPGEMVGTAPKANYYLYRTEDVGSEKPVEEFNWIAGAERADSAGVDMISSSLGYVNFDNSTFNHTYAQRDGNTALITIAADMAAKKGMIVMNSAGNSGNATNDTKYIVCPADGDSVMTVGAVNTSGVIGNFSSWGPTSNGKQKPNIVSVGWNAVFTNSAGNTATGNGTSYSNPNIAGLIACLWQAFNEFTNMEIIDAVEKSADRYNNPDYRYGHGIPNFRIAYALLDAKRLERTNNILNGKWIAVFPVPFKQVFTIALKAPSTGRASIKLFDLAGNLLQEKAIDVNQGNNYRMNMSAGSASKFGFYYLLYNDGKNSKTIKLIGR